MSKIAAIIFAVSVLSVHCVVSTAGSFLIPESGIRAAKAGQRSAGPDAAMHYSAAVFPVQGTIGGMTGGTTAVSPKPGGSDTPLLPKGDERIKPPENGSALPDAAGQEHTESTPDRGTTDGSALPDATVEESTEATPVQGATGAATGKTGVPDKGPSRKGSTKPAGDCATPTKILFDVGRDGIRDEQLGSIDRIGRLLQKNPSATAVIEGHADDKAFSPKQGENIASYFANMELSRRRAERVATYLAKKYGIDRSRIAVKWYGNTRPETGTGTLAERAENRRVDVIPDCEPAPE